MRQHLNKIRTVKKDASLDSRVDNNSIDSFTNNSKFQSNLTSFKGDSFTQKGVVNDINIRKRQRKFKNLAESHTKGI